jgi:hypothetical protein
MLRTDPSRRVRPLPRKIRLFPDETTTSFIGRLETANALSRGQLKHTLQKSRRPWVDTLAAWTEFDPGRLSLAMPQLSPQYIRLVSDPRLFGRPNRRIERLACRRCAHERGAVERIEIFTTHEKVVCPRHRLWLGDGVETPGNQISVRTCPGITAASRHHRNLISRFGLTRVSRAFHISAYINRRWYEKFHHFDEVAHLHKRLTVADEPGQTANYATVAGTLYPTTVRLASTLASPFWEQIAHSTRPGRFLDRVTAEVTDGWFPEGGADPLRRWMAENWSPGFTGSDAISQPLQS